MEQEPNPSGTNQYEYVIPVENGEAVPSSLEGLTSWYENTVPPALRERVSTANAIVEVRAYISTADSARASQLRAEKYVTDVSQLIRQILGSEVNIQSFTYGGVASQKGVAQPALGSDRLVVRIIA